MNHPMRDSIRCWCSPNWTGTDRSGDRLTPATGGEAGCEGTTATTGGRAPSASSPTVGILTGPRIQVRTGSTKRVTHRHIPGVFGRFFHVKAGFRPVTHPHVNRVFGC